MWRLRDFRLTVNPVCKLDQYPILKVEDLFAMLDKGDTFTKSGLPTTYIRQGISEISTHNGLFRDTRLPYGVSSVPGIFQRAIEMLLQGIPGVAVYIDDILITGQNKEVHLKSLQEVSHLERARLRAKRQKCIFMAPVSFWGMLLVPKVYTPSLIKFKQLKMLLNPKNASELKSYLGLSLLLEILNQQSRIPCSTLQVVRS